MLNPREFFDQYVMPCVTDWQLDPLNIRKAIIAISQIDILADHVIIHQHPGFTRGQLANVRKATEQNTPIRSQPPPPPPPKAKTVGSSNPMLSRNAFQVGTPVLEIVQDDETKHPVRA